MARKHQATRSFHSIKLCGGAGTESKAARNSSKLVGRASEKKVRLQQELKSSKEST
jgi:hypothetical protein